MLLMIRAGYFHPKAINLAIKYRNLAAISFTIASML